MIQFGTDGWRAVIGKEFTLENVNRVAWGVAQYAKDKGFQKGILVGFDRRKLSPESANSVIEVLTENEVSVWRIPYPFPRRT